MFAGVTKAGFPANVSSVTPRMNHPASNTFAIRDTVDSASIAMPLSQPLRIHELSPAELAIYRTLDTERIPEHIAIIMDGNGRWAGKRAMKRFLGHQQGAEAVHFVVEAASRINLPHLTLYAFSLENNLRRPKSEVSFLMKLLRTFLIGNVQRMQDNNVRMAYIGRTSELPEDVQETMHWAAAETAHNTGTTLTLALNYGSRAEMVDATKAILQKTLAEAKRRGISVEDLLAVDEHAGITEESLSAAMYTGAMPDPDLVIRTSGEMRISNFLLWQIAYAELHVTDVLWPDFRGLHLLEAIADFQRRERRYGGVGKAVTDEELPNPMPALQS